MKTDLLEKNTELSVL